MQTVTLTHNVFTIDELSNEAKEKAIERFRETNVDFDWWECTYEDFASICKTVGVTVNLKKTYFDGFSHQGSGSSFTADVDILAIYKGIHSESWKEHAPLLEKEANFKPSYELVSSRILKLIENGSIQADCSVSPCNRESSIKIDFNHDVYGYSNIEKELDKLESFCSDNLEELNCLLYKLLEKEYEYQTSEEAILETIRANDYQFLENGKLFA